MYFVDFNRLALSVVAVLACSTASAAVATFDSLQLPSQSHYFPEISTTFSEGGLVFEHDYSSTFGSWTGWTYSNEIDVTTEGFLNQFSAYTGGGQGGSSNYALSYVSIDASFQTVASEAALLSPSVVQGAYFTNTTYAALSMKNGDDFAKRFGGASGDDPDYFKLTISGLNAQGQSTGEVDFYLADYRFSDNSQDYIVDDWTYVDLSSLGVVSKLTFNVASTDAGAFGLNTPAYFAVDSIQISAVPEAGSGAMALVGLLGTAWLLRRRQRGG